MGVERQNIQMGRPSLKGIGVKPRRPPEKGPKCLWRCAQPKARRLMNA